MTLNVKIFGWLKLDSAVRRIKPPNIKIEIGIAPLIEGIKLAKNTILADRKTNFR